MRELRAAEALILVGGGAWTLFVFLSGAYHNVKIIPQLEARITNTERMQDSQGGKLDFIVGYIENRSGEKYKEGKNAR